MTEGKMLMTGLAAALALGVVAGSAAATPCPKGNIVLAAGESQAGVACIVPEFVHNFLLRRAFVQFPASSIRHTVCVAFDDQTSSTPRIAGFSARFGRR